MKITLLPGFNPGVYTGDGNNTYLISGHDPALVDAAIGDGRHLEALGSALGAARLARVLVTHAHQDHATGVTAISGRWPAAEFAKLPWPERDAQYPVAWRPLADGEAVHAGDGVLRVIHTPGHAPDHACFFSETEGVLFCGDLLVQGGSVVIPASHGGDLADYLASLARIRELGPARVLPAHGPEIDDVAGLIDQYVEHRRRREDQILAALGNGPATPRQVAAIVYADLDEALMSAAGESVLAHLRKLRAEGRVRRCGEAPDEAWEKA